ncbi:hypothetical protein IIY68_01475 [Candidatus Saccharibacteria bacterium]|nr:hypothetical protein [Candidatus Saccharibacteria bacterium]
MKNDKIGKIDISELNVPPEKHEYETAKYFAKRGYDVEFIGPHYIEGFRNPDFKMCGKIWEIKSPTSSSNSSFEHNFRKATSQSENIIFDLRRLNTRTEEKYIEKLVKGSSSSKIKTLFVITLDGRLLTIKGKFDNMKVR